MTPELEALLLADTGVRRAYADFVRAADPGVVSAVPALVGFARAVGGLTRFALDVVLEPAAVDPIGLTPRILRAA